MNIYELCMKMQTYFYNNISCRKAVLIEKKNVNNVIIKK